MKVAVLFGPGEVRKRAELLRIKKDYSAEVISTFDLSLNKISDIELALVSQNLFEKGNKLIIIENAFDDLDLKRFVKIENPATLVFLAPNPKSNSKLLLSAKEIKAKLINFELEEETSVFPFLDNLIAGKKDALRQLVNLLDEYGGMYILAMIYYLLRRNLLPPPKSVFMQKKIKIQKEKLSLRDWQKLYLKTLETDFAIKSGSLPESIAAIKLTQEFINYLR